VAGFDLVLAAETESRLREAADAGQALLVGRIVAGAAREITGARGRDVVLRGDCLAGFWAGATFGMADEGLYARALAAARQSMQALADEGPDAPRPLNDFTEGDLADRDAAFRAGAASGDVDACAAF
jgi:predicted metalloprotease